MNGTAALDHLEEIDGTHPAVARFLEKIVWGTEGARYSLCDYEATLRHLSGARFLALSDNGRWAALRMITEKQARRGLDPIHCFYHSMFCVDPERLGRGYGKKLAQAMLERLMPRIEPRGLIYSHVEKDNLRSLRIHQDLGYQPMGSFAVMSFSRLFPKPSAALTKLAPEEKPAVLEALRSQYADHALTDFELSLNAEEYYVLRSGNHLTAGVQVLPQRWIIRSLGGPGGSVALHALPHIPLVRRVFNPRNLRFLKLGHFFFQKGHAAAAQVLAEAVLARFQLNTAMMFWDPRSPVFQEFKAAGSFGFLNALIETPVQILGIFCGLEESQKKDLMGRPACISPLDL